MHFFKNIQLIQCQAMVIINTNHVPLLQEPAPPRAKKRPLHESIDRRALFIQMMERYSADPTLFESGEAIEIDPTLAQNFAKLAPVNITSN